MITRNTVPTSRHLSRRLSSEPTQTVRRVASVDINVPNIHHSHNTFLSSYNVPRPPFHAGGHSLFMTQTRRVSSIIKYKSFDHAKSCVFTDSHRQWLVQTHNKRDLTSSSGGNHNHDKTDTNTFEDKLKTLRELYAHVRSQISLDIWTLNVILFTFIVGPYVWNSMRTSRHNDDFYMIPVDDPVEHSVRILLDCAGQDSDQALQDIANNSPEEDAKRILNQFLASENIRTTASRIASEVIQMEPFQNACKKLVRNIWDDLINDKETYSQLTTLLYTVLQNEKMYSAVKDLLLQLVNDEEVNRELTKLVVKLGEEPDVLAATQQVLTKSAHRTMNDPNVLDHSMEFATEVMGDDVVQRTGGDALWNTVGYAVQPSGNAVLAGVGTLIVAGVLHFYMSRRGDGGSSGPKLYLSEDSGARDVAQSQLPTQFYDSPPTGNRLNFTPSSSNVNHSAASSFDKVMKSGHRIASIPSLLIGSILQTYDKLTHGVVYMFNAPSRLGSSMIELLCYVSERVSNKLSFLFLNCRTGVSGTFQAIIVHVKNTPNCVTDYWCHLLNIVLEYFSRMTEYASKSTDGASDDF